MRSTAAPGISLPARLPVLFVPAVFFAKDLLPVQILALRSSPGMEHCLLWQPSRQSPEGADIAGTVPLLTALGIRPWKTIRCWGIKSKLLNICRPGSVTTRGKVKLTRSKLLRNAQLRSGVS